ncbi:hypothetical protein KIMH_11600 [Bombiscardovia apis]|uniref:Transcriptional regulator n=1 Tax=Bombiscardovia apis TaxID=2932182 RepID=A0ABM8BDR6_9BIFI|nr:HTH domain-containing protein [Bombiscardovia apis]BDR55049.1 hypothetical protein KIMH_11600 [Bombiscardovia apis]
MGTQWSKMSTRALAQHAVESNLLSTTALAAIVGCSAEKMSNFIRGNDSALTYDEISSLGHLIILLVMSVHECSAAEILQTHIEMLEQSFHMTQKEIADIVGASAGDIQAVQDGQLATIGLGGAVKIIHLADTIFTHVKAQNPSRFIS